MKKIDYLKFIRKDISIGVNSTGLEPFFDLRNRIPNNRNYANGRQEVGQFRRAKVNKADGATKDMIDLWEKMEEKIDWTPRQILAPKLNVAVTITTQKERTFFTRAVDEVSAKKRKDRENMLRGAMNLKQSGIPAEAIGMETPETEDQLQEMAAEATMPIERSTKEAIEYILHSQNNYYTDIELGLARNLLTDGLCVVKVEIDGNFNIVPRVCDPVNMYFSIPDKKNFSDCTYFCERIWLTMNELKAFDKEKEYKDSDWALLPQGSLFSKIMKYPVLDIEFLDTEKVDGVEIPVWRKCKYVEGSNELLLDYGIVDFQGMGDNMQQPRSSFIAYTPYVQNSIKSIIPLVEKVIPEVDSYYITQINKQFEKANAPTRMVSYSIDALAKSATLFGVTPKEILLYQRMSGINFKNDSMPGSQGGDPVILDGGLSSNYNLYLTDEQNDIRAIQDILGIPAGVDASMPDAKQPVYSQKLAAGGANNALFVIAESLNQMFSMTLRSIAQKLKYLVVAHKMGLIKTTYAKFFDDAQEDIMLEEFMERVIDFSFVAMPSQEAMERIDEALNIALQAGQIDVTDKIEIFMQAGYDLEKANAMLAKKIAERRAQAEQVQIQTASAAAEANGKAATEASEKEIEKIKLKGEIDERLLQMKINAEVKELPEIVTRTPTLLKNSYSVSTNNFMQKQVDVVVSDTPDKLYDYVGQPVGEPKNSYSGMKANGRYFIFITVDATEELCAEESYNLMVLMNGIPTRENYREYSKNAANLAKMVEEVAETYIKEEKTEK